MTARAIPLNILLTPLEATYLKPEPVVSLEEFCERDLSIPEGLAAGKYMHSTLPFVFEILHKLGKKEKQFNVIVGPKQTGKTVVLVSLVLYIWLELNQSLVLGYPTRDLAAIVYETKILPVIEASPYLFSKLPKTGVGSKGGTPNKIKTLAGSYLYLLGAGGSDAQMSGVTAGNVLLDEIDKMQNQKGGSVEGSPIDQMITRADAFQLDRQVMMICTVTTETGRIWKEYIGGTRGLPYYACPHCKNWILFEFDRHIFGEFFKEQKERATQFIYDDTSKSSAEKTARLECPLCEKKINNKQRLAALPNPRWVYRGQKISKKGKVTGQVEDVQANSWRWNQLHSPFTSLGLLAVDHFNSRSTDLKQQGFQLSKMALPWREDTTVKEFKRSVLVYRIRDGAYQLRNIPEEVEFIILCADVQKRMIYWWASGFDRKGNKWMIDLGVIHIIRAHSDADPSDDAIRSALDELKEISDKGWYKKDSKTVLTPARNGIDISYRPDVLVPWINQQGTRWQSIKGRGGRAAQAMTGKHVEAIDGLLYIRKQKEGHLIFFVDVNESKGRIQDSFLIPRDARGHHALPSDLLPEFAFWTFALIAEQREEVITSTGETKIVWIVKKRNQNHMLDVGGYIIALGEFQIRLLNFKDQQAKEPAETTTKKTTNQSDGINRSY